MAIVWPLWVIDFEASSLSENSYPIEVGIACWPTPSAGVSWFSTLIQPDSKWTEWSTESEAVHGINRDALGKSGSPVEKVVKALNIHLGPCRVYSDGGIYDVRWMVALHKSADIWPSYLLRPIDDLLPIIPESQRHLLLDRKNISHPHRAGPDAAFLLQAFAMAIGYSPSIRHSDQFFPVNIG